MKNKIAFTAVAFLLLSQANAQLTVTLSLSTNDTVCQYQNVNFTATISGCLPLFTTTWYDNGTPVFTSSSNLYSSTFSLGFPTPGSHCIVSTVTSASAACSPNIASDTICIWVVQNQPPSVTINATTPNPFCVGSLAVFTATPFDAGSCATYTWYVDGVPDLSSSTSIFNYVSLTAGVHVVYCEVHSCDYCDNQPPVNNPTAISNIFTVNVVVCTAVNEIENNPFVKIYPNPTDGEINLQWENPSGGESEIFISNYIGKIISEYRTTKNSLSIEEAELESGIYFVTIKIRDKLFHAPVVIY